MLSDQQREQRFVRHFLNMNIPVYYERAGASAIYCKSTNKERCSGLRRGNLLFILAANTRARHTSDRFFYSRTRSVLSCDGCVDTFICVNLSRSR